MLFVLMMMTGLAVVVAGGVAVGGGAVWLARSRSGGGPPLLAAPVDRPLKGARAGDVVEIGASTWIVAGRVDFLEQGSARAALGLVDGAARRWLYIQEGDRQRLWLLEDAPGLTFEARPADTLSVGEVGYKLEAMGEASASVEGSLDPSRQGGQIGYYHFKGFGDHVLVVERWGRDYKSMTGRQLQAGSATLLPAGQVG